MCLQTILESVNGLRTLDGDGERAQRNACQNLPGDNKVSSREVYPQIVETSQVCRETVVITSKVKPCHVEPCRPATGSCNLFCSQLAASVDLSILVLYGHISAARRQCAQHSSGSVVAETLNIDWYHREGCCNNPNGIHNFFSRGFVEVLSNFTDGIQLIVDIVANFVYMIK